MAGGGGSRSGGTSTDHLLTELRRRSGKTVRDRWRRAKSHALLTAQAGLAAALAWAVAHHLLGHPEPFFAPIAAVITLGIATGQRLRRAAEIIIGVAVGIAVGDALIYLIGTGAWQIGLVVVLATFVAIFAGGTGVLVSQAASSAILVATLTPPDDGIYYTRMVDALVGGGLALAVMALVLPANPLTAVSRTARPALGVLVDGLFDTAKALTAGDADRAQEALDRLTEGEEKLAKFRGTLPEGQEAATIAPLRWRARNALTQYVEAAEYIEHALGNARVLTRRTVTLLNDREPVPQKLPAAVATLAEAVREVRRELGEGVTPEQASELAVRAVREASEAYREGLGFSGSVLVAQVRAIATDLLGTAGLSHQEAVRMVRRAGGTPAQR